MESLPWTSIISHLNESIDLQDDKGQHITCTPSKRLIRTNRTYPITTEAWQPIDPVNEDTFILTKFISPEPASLRRPRSLIFLVLVICLGAKTGPTLYTNGTAKSSDSATLECFQMLTQPLKFCTSVTKCSLLPFIRFPPFIPTLTPPPPKPPLAPLSCLRAWLNRDEDTLRGVGRDEGDPFYLFSWNPRSWVIPCLPNSSACVPSISKPLLLADYKNFFLDRCCLCL